MFPQWHIGLSGFHYKEWKGLFYPAKLPVTRWFEYYCQHFRTLEINNTFYRFPEVKTLQNWYMKSPPDFVFSLKVPQAITHLKGFIDTRQLIADFYQVVKEGLREKAGAILFQLPPKFTYSNDRLDLIIRQLDNTMINVLEFRHNSWWRREVFDALERNNMVFCGQSYPGLIDEVIITAPHVYYRFHGVPRLYHSGYDEKSLKMVIDSVRIDRNVLTAFLYFNNTASMEAIANANFALQYAAV